MSFRYRTFIAQEVGASVRDVFALVLGGHGDTMVPLPSMATVSGIPITQLLSQDKVDEIVQRTRQGGAEIVDLLGSGSAFYAPAAAICEIVDAIILDQKRILPVAAHLTGQYGVKDLYVGVPALIGAGGIEEVIEIALDDEARANLGVSVDAVKELLEACKGIDSSLA